MVVRLDNLRSKACFQSTILVFYITLNVLCGTGNWLLIKAIDVKSEANINRLIQSLDWSVRLGSNATF